ncbi:MAG: carbohydrate ABC transporter permease [Acidimicrobiia bacterium]
MTQVSLPQTVGTDPLDLEMDGVGAAERGGRFWSGRTRYLLGAVSIVMCVVMLTPIVLSVAASLKTTEEAATVPPTYFPSDLSQDNYQKLWDYGSGLPRYLANSVITATLTIVMTLILTVPAGYGLARFPIPGKEVIFVFLLLALIIPYQALLTPVFLMFSTLGLTNSLFGLAIVHTMIQLPFSLYIMRNAFEAVPRELEEAALVDGASSWQVLRRVFMPNMVPAVITVTLFAFVMSWNEFLGALVMLTRDTDLTLPLVLAATRSVTSLGSTDWGMLQAGVTVAIIPCVLFYLLLQRYYVSGLLTGAVK